MKRILKQRKPEINEVEDRTLESRNKQEYSFGEKYKT